MSPAKSLWRIAQDTPEYSADDLSGKGAEEAGGRWNRRGTAMLYCSSSIALACLETLVHLAGRDPLPFNRYLVRVEVPPSAWRARTMFDPGEHVGWDSIPPGIVSLSWGSAWASCARSLLAEIPSVVVPEESNILVNPRHPDARRLRSRKMRRWTYDIRMENPQARVPSH